MRTTISDLIASNVELLEQALLVIEGLDDRIFTRTVPGIPSLRVGVHLRHVLEFYECFLDGIPSRVIDYEQRRRDRRVETSRTAAVAKTAAIMRRLDTFSVDFHDGEVAVRPEDAPNANEFLRSTIARELQVLNSHTIHHFALIAVTLQALGVSVSPSFGVARSTLRYREAAA
jgi:uncharacterized damage-inducible protein DinB